MSTNFTYDRSLLTPTGVSSVRLAASVERISFIKESPTVWKTTFKIGSGFPVGSTFGVIQYRLKTPNVNFECIEEIIGTDIIASVQYERAIEADEFVAIVVNFNSISGMYL